jgi:hypothetical protein
MKSATVRLSSQRIEIEALVSLCELGRVPPNHCIKRTCRCTAASSRMSQAAKRRGTGAAQPFAPAAVLRPAAPARG